MVELGPAQEITRDDGPGNNAVTDDLIIERHGVGTHSVTCKWNIVGFGGSNKQKVLYSKYFEVGGYDCRLLVYPSGDAQALPGYMSVYLQISDPSSSSSKWDCFASYQLAVRNLADDSKSVRRDSWHRFSAKKRSHGWCDFAALSTLFDPKQGFLGPDNTIQVSTDIMILDEAVAFTRENDLGGTAPPTTGEVYSGKFVWKVQNFSVFQPLLRTQKIMSPAFPAGDCALRMSVYQSTVGGNEHLSLCLESRDTERSGAPDRTCWCLFRLAVQPQEDGGRTIHRDSYGRFACDGRSGDNTSLGWNDFMRMDAFLAPTAFYLVEDTAVFSTSFHVIRESASLLRYVEPRGSVVGAGGVVARPRDKRKAVSRETDWSGRFQWRLENFTKLKDLLKKRKITGLCIKSRRFSIAGKDCRLIVYPRGQSQPPTFLSVFLEVTDSSPPSPDWTCFVSHRLSVVNQRGEFDRSISKESQNRYSKSAKDWGWREFVSLTTLFDADAGFVVNDAVVFSAEVLVLKESSDIKRVPVPVPVPVPPPIKDNGDAPSSSVVPDEPPNKVMYSWRIENFVAFKEVVETRKIFSKYFSVGPCDVRVGLYESFDSLCVYLESDTSMAQPANMPPPHGSKKEGDPTDPSTEKPKSFWVRYRAAILNQRHPERTQWRDGSVHTRVWNNSVLQFPRIGGPGADQGLILRDSLALAVEILECRPWVQESDGSTAASSAGVPLSGAGGAGQLAGDTRNGDGQANLVATFGRTSPSNSGGLVRRHSSSSLASSGEYHDEDDDTGDDQDDDDDDDDNGISAEETVSRWFSAVGVEFLGHDTDRCPHPLLAFNVDTVQDMIAKMVSGKPDAVFMLMESLRMYMCSRSRVERLLMPCISIEAAQPWTPSKKYPVQSLAPAIMTILAGIPSLRWPLMNMLVDVMLDSTLTAKMHRHLLGVEKKNPEGDGCEEPAVIMDKPLSGPDAIHSPDPQIEFEKTLRLILGWMQSVDLARRSADGELAAQSGPNTADSAELLSPLHKISMLLTDAPQVLEADIITLLPRLVGPREHEPAAGALLARLAEASREGPEAEAKLRFPVLAALGSLQMDGKVAEKVFQAAVNMVPQVPADELNPVIGLTLKLVSRNGVQLAALTALLGRIRSLFGPTGFPPSDQATEALLALRLSIMQHPSIMTAFLAAIQEDWPEGVEAGNKPQLGIPDLRVLLDCLAFPDLRDQTYAVLEAVTRAGGIDEVVFGDCFSVDLASLSKAEMMDRFLSGTPGQLCISKQDFCFQVAASIEGSNSQLTDAMATHLWLNLSSYRHGSLPPPDAAVLTMIETADELGGVLMAAERMLLSTAERFKDMGSVLYIESFDHYTDAASERRILESLAQTAFVEITSGIVQPEKAVEGSNDEVVEYCNSYGLATRLLSNLSRDRKRGVENALVVLLEMMLSTSRTLKSVQTAASSAAACHTAEIAAQRALVDKAEASARKSAEQLSEFETQLARRLAEHRAEVSGLASDRKELQAQLRSVEQQVEWVRSERDEERAARSREARDAAQKYAELEAQMSRLKITRRDEQKRAQKDRSALLDHVRELEETLERAEAEIARIRSEMAATITRNEKAVLDARRRAETAEHIASTRGAEANALRAALAERDAQLRTALEGQRSLEQVLAAERHRVASIIASNASTAGLQSHLGSLTSQTASGSGSYSPQLHHHLAPPHAHAHSQGSLDSLRSIAPALGANGDNGPAGGGGLFSGTDWGLTASRQASAPLPTADDSANMEKLLGLLPSDLLHS